MVYPYPFVSGVAHTHEKPRVSDAGQLPIALILGFAGFIEK